MEAKHKAEGLIEAALDFSDEGRNEEALADLDKAIELAPRNPRSFVVRGSVYSAMERYEEALADLDKAIELGSEDIWTFELRGSVYLQMGRYEEALADLDKAIELAPRNPWSFFARGGVYAEMGRREEALADFDKASELDQDGHYQQQLQEGYSLLREAAQPADMGMDATAQVEGDATAQVERLLDEADTLEDGGRYEEALDAVNRAVELAPQYPLSFALRGGLYMQMDRYEEALADVDKAMELTSQYAGGPQDANAFFSTAFFVRGVSHSGLGRYEEAVADLDRAIELDPQNAEAVEMRDSIRDKILSNSSVMYCRNCGTQLPTDARFCSSCGTPTGGLPSADVAEEVENYEYLEIEAADVGTRWGASLWTSLLGSPSLDKCQFIARAWDEEQRWEAATADFTKYAGVSFDEMKERPNEWYEQAQQQLDWLHETLVAHGWIPIERGVHWYSYRYKRPKR